MPQRCLELRNLFPQLINPLLPIPAKNFYPKLPFCNFSLCLELLFGNFDLRLVLLLCNFKLRLDELPIVIDLQPDKDDGKYEPPKSKKFYCTVAHASPLFITPTSGSIAPRNRPKTATRTVHPNPINIRIFNLLLQLTSGGIDIANIVSRLERMGQIKQQQWRRITNNLRRPARPRFGWDWPQRSFLYL